MHRCISLGTLKLFRKIFNKNIILTLCRDILGYQLQGMENSIPAQIPFPQPPSQSHLTTMLHIHLAMATKPSQLINNVISIILLLLTSTELRHDISDCCPVDSHSQFIAEVWVQILLVPMRS